MDPKTLEIALSARRACEAYYTKLQRRGIPHPFDENLCCMCAIAANFLSAQLSRHSIHSILVAGWFKGQKHTWLEFEDGTILDITATQFLCDKYPKVFIVGPNDPHHGYYQKDSNVDQNFATWIESQRPDYKKNREISRHLPRPRRESPAQELRGNPLETTLVSKNPVG